MVPPNIFGGAARRDGARPLEDNCIKRNAMRVREHAPMMLGGTKYVDLDGAGLHGGPTKHTLGRIVAVLIAGPENMFPIVISGDDEMRGP